MKVSSVKFGFCGIALGAVSLMLALVSFWAGPFSPQPSLEETVAETAVSIRDATVAALRGEEYESSPNEPQFSVDDSISIAIPVLGGLAVILGVVGFALKEPFRVSGGAAFLGISAITFQFAALALGAIILVVLVIGVLTQLGFE